MATQHRAAPSLARRTLVFCLPLLLGPVLLTVPACGDEDRDGGKRAAPPADPNRDNPFKGRYVDLSREPFHPEWVGGHLVFARTRIPDQLNNLLWKGHMGEDRISRYFLFPRLVMETADRVDGDFRLEPWAAASLPERQPDDLTWIWKLREDLTWEDGTPVTAHDYAFTFRMLRNPAVEAHARRGSLDLLEDVEAVDDHTLRVRYVRPYYNAVANFGLEFTVVPRHDLPGDPAGFNGRRRHQSFGPYRIALSDSRRLVLELRPEYREEPFPVHPCYVERVEYRRVDDPASALAQMRKGDVHLSLLPHDRMDELRRDEAFMERNWITSFYMPGYQFIAWNLWEPGDKDFERPHPIFSDRRVRQAMSHLIPRERIISQHFPGRGVPCSGPFFFKSDDVPPDLEPTPYDPGEARRLLDKAGWRLEPGRGVRVDEEGREMRFTILGVGNPSYSIPLTVFQEEARKAGVLVELDDDPSYQEDLTSRNYDAFAVRFGLTPPVEPDVRIQWHSEAVGPGGYNFPGLMDQEVDALIDGYRRCFEPARRRELRRKLHRRIHELQPYAFLYSLATPAAVSRRWANVKVHELGFRFWDFVWRERWDR